MSDDEAATKEDSCCEECCESCHKMVESIAEMKAKLDSVLSCIEEIKEPKQKQTSLEEKNKPEASLEFANTSIEELKKKMAVQGEAIDELKKGVKSLTKQVEYEKQKAIKLESHSRRNNLNFFNIPEQRDESFENSETILRKFMAAELKISKEDVDDISFERVHRIGKSSLTDSKPRPLIAKFTYHKDKEFVISRAKNLRDTNFAVARDFPKEIVNKRKLLLPNLKDAKKKGHTATLVYHKLYINGQLYRP